MPYPGEALSKYGESDSAWRQNCPKMLSLSEGKFEVGEGDFTLRQNCCHLTAVLPRSEVTLSGLKISPGE